MDSQAIREDFPILRDIIYLDNASTSLTPEPILKAILNYYHGYRANVGRGVYRLAQLAEQRYRDAHFKLASFIDAKEGTIIFTRNTTESINIISQGIQWKKGDGVVTTLLEHHSNLLPWMRLKKGGVELKIIEPDNDGLLQLSDFDAAIDKNTKLVAMSHHSNVLGSVLPVYDVSRICQERGVMFLVDGAQSIPHMPVAVKDLGCDFLCFSGHKMLGPTGTGVLWIKCEERIDSLMTGGGMVEDVSHGDYKRKNGYEGFEAGTPDIAGGIGLGAAADYLKKVGLKEIHDHEIWLTNKLLEGLKMINGVEVYGPSEMKGRSGIVSFNVRGLLPHEVALLVDETSSIMVRSGHHCCIPLMKHLGLKYGTVRASVYLYNTKEEIEKLLAIIEKIAKAA